MDRETQLQAARALIGQGRFPEGWAILEPFILDDPEDIQALVVADYLNIQSRNYSQAYFFARRVSELAPRDPAAWINLAQACKFLQREKEGERAAKHGLSIAKKTEDQVTLYLNLASIYIDAGRFAEAEIILKKALSLTPNDSKALANLGMCQLALHNWMEGWKNYRSFMRVSGAEGQPRQVYCEPQEPEWSGGFGEHVLLYANQGLGDEIAYASIVNDAAERCEKLMLNVDPRLKNLFTRSFPNVTVYGQRDQRWTHDVRIDASLPMSQIGEFFRLTDADFPAEPYLKADPDRVFMWRALFKAKGKPIIGVAWSGGLWHTGSKFRKCSLASMLPLFRSVDAHFVSLQYRDAAKEIAEFKRAHPEIDLVQYPHGTLTSDYDDTAGLVAALDCVVSVPTAVVHLAGALGTPCICLKSPKSCWKFAGGLAFHPEVELIENTGDWGRAINKAAQSLTKRFRKLEAA